MHNKKKYTPSNLRETVPGLLGEEKHEEKKIEMPFGDVLVWEAKKAPVQIAGRRWRRLNWE